MKSFYLSLSFILLIGFNGAFSQCAFDNTFALDLTPPPGVGGGTSSTSCIFGGQYATVTVINGFTYTFTTCGNTAFDTELTLYNQAGTTVLGYNDDDCGLQSTITWTATFDGVVNILVDQFPCTSNSTCMDLVVTSTAPSTAGTGCNTDVTICNPGVAGPFTFGAGGNAVSSCLDFIGNGYGYIVLYITQSGNLEMEINGDAATGFLDVAVFDAPPGTDPCLAADDINNEIACNYASASSGCNQIGTAFPCPSSVPTVPVLAGDVLFIVVENYSGTSNNFTLELANNPTSAQTGPPDGTVTPVGPLCDTDAPIQLDAANNGGTWSGPGTSASGIFDPAAAGIGTHTVNYTIGTVPCDAQGSTTITVQPCTGCFFSSLSSSTGPCLTGSVFDLTGDFTFSGNPGSGTILVSYTNGSGTVTQTINPPFIDGNTYNFALQPATDGSNGTLTISFTADPTCDVTQAITSPVACDCAADLGTFTTSGTGTIAGNNVTLCFGETIDITSNLDYTPADEALAPANPGGYEPGISWLVYSCPPSIALTPSSTPPNDDILNDPCLVTLVSDFDLNEFNDMYWINAYPGVFTNNTVYFVPITMYNLTEGLYSYTNTSLPCYELGTPYAVTYVPQVTATVSQNCPAGTATATVSGGQPAINGSNFTAVPGSLVPATASFVNTTAANGGTITISGLTNGQAFSFDIEDVNGCSVTVSGTFVGPTSSAFTYPQAAYCKNAANPTPTITGAPGGTFTASPAGISINAATGTINLAGTTAGTYTVTYTSPGACNSTTNFVITINPNPVVTVPGATICAGQSATLTVTSPTAGNTYAWSPGATLSATTGTSVTATPATTTVYNIVATTTATGCTGSGTATVTVNPLPIVNAGADVAICNGQSTTLNASGANTYSWSPAIGLSATTGSSVTASPTSNQTYTVTGTSAAGCVNTDQVAVTVNALPIVNAPDATICIGNSTTITATGANTYTWSPATGLSATTGNPVTANPGATQNYTVTGTDANGCQASDNFTVTVLPNAPIVASADVSICAGQSTTISAAGGVSYTWNNGLGAGASHTVSPATTTTYTVVGQDASGCSGTDQVIVTVNPLPTVNAGLDVSVCAGQSTNLVASGATTYSWSPATGLSATTGSNVTATPATTTLYTVVGTTAAGCSASDQVNVTVNNLPVVNVNDAAICAGQSTTLTATGANTYSWSPATGLSATTGNPVTATPAATQNYVVTGTDANGCQASDNFTVTVNPLPIVNAGPDVAICAGQSTTLSASGAATYSWNNGLGAGQNQTVSPASTTSYTVTGTTAAGCSSTDIVQVTVNANPSPVINGTLTYCQGNSSTLSTTVPYTTYLWSPTGATTASASFTDVNNPITVTVTNAAGCTATSAAVNVTENNVITYNTTVTICQGQSANIHGTNQTVAGVYSQTYTLGTGCDSTSNVTLVVNPLPAINAGPDQTVCNNGTQVTLTATGPAGTTYSWSPAVTNGVAFTPNLGPTTYTVTGTDVNGCQNTDQVVVTNNALPVVNAGPDQAVCSGQTVTLNGAGANTYTWSGGVTNGTPFTPALTTNYTVTGTDANGCQNTDQVQVVVNTLPVVNAPDAGICPGGNTNITATGANTYTWSPAAGLSATTGTTVNATPAATTNYTVTGTDVNGCQSSDNFTVTVYTLPNVTTNADQSICEGSNASIEGFGAVTYSWDNGIGAGATHTVSPATTTTYTVTGTDANGCQNTDAVIITVNPIPTVVASPDVAICAGETTSLSASGANTYSWTPVTNLSSTTGTPVDATPAVTTTYTVVGTTAAGCSASDDVTVTVNPNPVISAGTDITICEGEQAVLTGSGAGVGGLYSWDNGVTNGVLFTPGSGTTTYTVTGTSSAGCSGTDVVNINVVPTPMLSFDYVQDGVCAPVTVTLTNTSGVPLTNCQWTLETGNTYNNCGPIVTTINTPGTYGVLFEAETDPTGCYSSIFMDDIIVVDANPDAAFTTSGNVVSTLNTTVDFFNNSQNADNYYWDFGNFESSTAVNPSMTYDPDEPGSYFVTLIASTNSGCTDTATTIIQVVEETIYYVPNTFTPDDDQFNQTFGPVFTSGFDPFDYHLTIFNRWGEIVFESYNAEIGWDGTYGGDGKSLNKCQDGTYVWKIEFKKTQNDERVSIVGHVNLLR